MLGPTPAREAAARCEALLADVEREPILEPTVLSVLANVEAMQGHEMRALELLERWRHAVEELGDTVWLSAINFGFVTLADDPVAAERELRPGYEALRKIGEKSHFSSVTGSLARAVCAQGRYEEADQLSRESEQAARPNDIHSHILWRTVRATVLANRGELDAAEKLAREAVAFAAGSDFLDSHGDALTDLAAVLVIADRPMRGHVGPRASRGPVRVEGQRALRDENACPSEEPRMSMGAASGWTPRPDDRLCAAHGRRAGTMGCQTSVSPLPSWPRFVKALVAGVLF